MPSTLADLNFPLYDLPADKVTGTWTSDGTVDAAYPLTNIDDTRPWKPVKYTVNPSFLLMDFGSAKPLYSIAFIHCNFDSPIHVQMNATNAWGGPSLDALVTYPGPTEDGFPSNPWMDLTAQTGYNPSGYRFLRITTANVALLSLGLIRLSGNQRQLTDGFISTEAGGSGMQRVETYPVLEFNTEGSVQLGYSLGVRGRQIGGQFRNVSLATRDLILTWYRSCLGRYSPFLLIPDPSLNDAWWVKWGVDPTWSMNVLKDAQHRYTVSVAWEEVGRGLKP